MLPKSDYRSLRMGRWKLTVQPANWNRQLEETVLALAERASPARHPRIHALSAIEAGRATPVYLKIFHSPFGWASLKELFRESKAARFLRQGLALEQAGFAAPETIAIGETRRCRYLRRAFVVTAAVPGESLIAYLSGRQRGGGAPLSFKEKKQACEQLASTIRRFHNAGFVHGDPVPSNLFVAEQPGGAPIFYFMDNDRTRRYPAWLPQRLWRRNLVQLNRFPLPGISLQDRLRFFEFYLGRRRRRRPADDCLLRWLEARTRRRRQECDALDPATDFRRLMRWRETPRKGT